MTTDPASPRSERRAREAAALRENLRRRKSQSRAADPAQINDLLRFWFLDTADPAYGQMRPIWFRSSPEWDAEIAGRFRGTVEAAAAGHLDEWSTTATGALALALLLDQFPRNLFRGQARAFATDAKARTLADAAVAAGFDKGLEPIQRVFIYLPFEHSETMADQHRSVALFEALPPSAWRDEAVAFAHRHLAAIERFGRFPGRNAALGRVSTPEEIAYLAANPIGF